LETEAMISQIRINGFHNIFAKIYMLCDIKAVL